VSKQITACVPILKNALNQIEKSGIHKNMATLNSLFEDLETNGGGFNGGLDGVMGESAADSSAVNDLLSQMQGEMSLEQQ
jgi:hypothetical protein